MNFKTSTDNADNADKISAPSVSFVDKKNLREELRARVARVQPDVLARASLGACELLRCQSVWSQSKTVLFYAPVRGELDITPLLHLALESKKTVALPGFLPESGHYGVFEIRDFQQDCVSGKFGILEPDKKCRRIALNRLDLALVPGVGFDAWGHRLGRGRGFYDRLLAQVTGIKCGVAFDEQMVDRIPTETHDVTLNFVLTPTQWLAATP